MNNNHYTIGYQISNPIKAYLLCPYEYDTPEGGPHAYQEIVDRDKLCWLSLSPPTPFTSLSEPYVHNVKIGIRKYCFKTLLSEFPVW